MKKIIPIIIVGIFVLSGLGAVALSSDEQEIDFEIMENEKDGETLYFSHNIFSEFATATSCGYCKYAHGALKQIYEEGSYPFMYVTLVTNKNTHANARANEYNTYYIPDVFFDGGYQVVCGASSVPSAVAAYSSAINSCGNRAVLDVDVELDITWLGNAAMDIEVSIDNNETNTYDGTIRVYVTEVSSTMGWHDTWGYPYTFPFLDYAFNEVISIDAGGTWTDSINWDGHDYNDGYGHTFGNILYGNIMVFAAVFNSERHQGYAYPPSGYPFDAYYVDDATEFRVGDNSPPYEPGNPDPYDGETDVDIEADLSWTGGDPNQWNPDDTVTYDVYFGTTNPPPLVENNHTTNSYDPGTLEYEQTYYWKIVAWDDHDASAEGPIWDFTTGNSSNNPPDTPDITGPESGKPETTYLYVFDTIDPDGDDVFYYVDWGDETFEDWIGPYNSGEEASADHSWNEQGTYIIKVKAKDSHGAESDWGTLEVAMPVNQRPYSNLFNLLTRLFERFPLFEQLILNLQLLLEH